MTRAAQKSIVNPTLSGKLKHELTPTTALLWMTLPGASRNFLFDSDLTIKFCAFSEASLLPLDVNMDTVDDNGYTTRIDIGFLGAVIYEAVTGEKCEIDLFKDNLPTDGRARWPWREFLPDTENVWLGSIIQGCWVDGGFRNARSLLQVLESITLHSPVPKCLNEQPL